MKMGRARGMAGDEARLVRSSTFRLSSIPSAIESQTKEPLAKVAEHDKRQSNRIFSHRRKQRKQRKQIQNR